MKKKCIEARHDLLSDEKVVRICDLTCPEGKSEIEHRHMVIGALLILGMKLSRGQTVDIDATAGIQGFSRALEAVDWVWGEQIRW